MNVNGNKTKTRLRIYKMAAMKMKWKAKNEYKQTTKILEINWQRLIGNLERGEGLSEEVVGEKNRTSNSLGKEKHIKY